METDASLKAHARKVSWPLVLGIALLPGIFVWFLLRHGHSTLSRVLGFSWAGLLLFASAAALNSDGGPSRSGDNDTAVADTASAEASTGQEATSRISDQPDLDDASQQMKALYEELNKFKGDREFHQVGFNPCCRFNDWKLRVEELDRVAGDAIFKELQVSPRELLQLGLQYARNEGRETSRAREITARIQFALEPSKPMAGSGMITGEGWWCRDIETWFASLRAMEEGDFATAENMRDEPHCPHVLPNMKTGPELDRRYYQLLGSDVRLGFVKVKLENGPEIWAPIEEIEFQ